MSEQKNERRAGVGGAASPHRGTAADGSADRGSVVSVPHTPGPWGVSSGFVVCESSEARVVANCIPLTGVEALMIEPEVARANARLIAAAPDLLAALKAVVLRTNVGNAVFVALSEERAEAALAAIAKATEGR